MILGFDTATPATAVALRAPDGALAEARHDPEPGERPGHAVRLLALVAEVMERAGAGWGDVRRIAVGLGPGGFTGLRIGIATARGLAQARDLELAGVSTLRALAHAAAGTACDRPTLAVLDARRGEAFAAAWWGERELLAPGALAPGELAARAAALVPGPLAVGDGAVRFRDALERAGATIAGDESPLHRVSGAAICQLAVGAPGADRDALAPDYRRLPDAEIAYRRRHQ